jgi:hypothetical protein
MDWLGEVSPWDVHCDAGERSGTGRPEVETVKAGAEKLTPEEFILAALSTEQRLEAAFLVAREAFRGTTLAVDDVEEAVRKVRRKRGTTRGTKATRRR